MNETQKEIIQREIESIDRCIKTVKNDLTSFKKHVKKREEDLKYYEEKKAKLLEESQ